MNEKEHMTNFLELEKELGYSFKNKKLLMQALTHSTYAYEQRENNGSEDNERLEFLGDGLLDFVIADRLYELQNEKDEGYLSKTRALIVCEATLAEKAIQINLGDYLFLGKGELQTGGKEKASNLANAMEALFAAVYLDNGFTDAKNTILKMLESFILQAIAGEIIFDYKSKILEMAQTKRDNIVSFAIVNEDGPVHDRIYTAALYLNDSYISEGKGVSKKLAEQAAARTGFERVQMMLYEGSV